MKQSSVRIGVSGAAVCLLLLVGIQSAHAAGSASVTVGQVQFEVTDLDVSDGVTPTLTFNGWYSLASGWIDPLNGYPVRPSPDPIQSYYEPGGVAPNSFPATEGAISVPGMSSASKITSYSLNLNAISSSGLAAAQASVGSSFNPDWSAGFMLTPHTSFSISANIGVQASSDGASVGSFYWQLSESRASVLLNIQDATGAFVPGGGEQFEVDTMGNAATLQSSRILRATFVNSTDEAAYGSFYISADAYASAVPEPSSATLALIGFGVVALRSHRRIKA